MRRVSRPPRRGSGGVGNDRKPSVGKASRRSPRKRAGSAASGHGSRSPKTTADPHGEDAQTPVNTNKPVAQMRSEIEQLERIVNERRLFYKELTEEGDSLVRMLAGDADDILAKYKNYADEDEGGPSMTEEEEIQFLTRRNAQLMRELRAAIEAERRYSNDPKVLDKRNEVNHVKMQIRQVEEDIQTLQAVKKRRDGALRAIDHSEQMAREVRGQQREVANELRTELKALMEKLRVVEKEDVDAHEHHARLQEQIKVGVCERALEELKKTLESQDEEIKDLTASAASWKGRKEGFRAETLRMLAREQKACIALEREVDRLRAQLIKKEAEMR